jgi:hypothetical protein
MRERLRVCALVGGALLAMGASSAWAQDIKLVTGPQGG